MKTPWYIHLIFWGAIILFILVVNLILSLPEVAAAGWDWRCLWVQCRLTL